MFQRIKDLAAKVKLPSDPEKLVALGVLVAAVLVVGSFLVTFTINSWLIARHDSKIDRQLTEANQKISGLETSAAEHAEKADVLAKQNEDLRVDLRRQAQEVAATKAKTVAGEKEIARVKSNLSSSLASYTVPADIVDQCRRACANAAELGLVDKASTCDCQR